MPSQLGPVIALVAQSLYGKLSYTPASYVKWLEMAGGRVTLVPYDASDATVDEIFNKTNGALYIGGGSSVPQSARRFYKNMVAAHAAGDTYPLWGTCDGFEWLMQIMADDDSVLTSGFDSENISLPLNLTTAARSSRLFADASRIPIQGMMTREGSTTVLQALESLPITLNNHHQGVTPSDYSKNPKLPNVVNILSTNRDRKGKEFISTVEGAKGLPVWATQFHPEKNIFEQTRAIPKHWWPYEQISHTRAAVAASQYMANFFVDQARGSSHRYETAEEEWKALVYQKTTTTSMAPGFAQIYTFRSDED